MLKLLIDHKNTCLYKIACKDRNCYVGHTTEFATRKRLHRSSCFLEEDTSYTMNVYQFMRGNGGFENFEMVSIDIIPCTDKLDALKKKKVYGRFECNFK